MAILHSLKRTINGLLNRLLKPEPVKKVGKLRPLRATTPSPHKIQPLAPRRGVLHTNGTKPHPHQRDTTILTVLGTVIKTLQRVFISLRERLQGLYIIGATGTGKTTLILNMILSDIKEGLGVCLIEPHSDLTRHVIAAMPVEKLKDVIYLDITDSSSSFGLNFF